jgi:hypothetical protein
MGSLHCVLVGSVLLEVRGRASSNTRGGAGGAWTDSCCVLCVARCMLWLALYCWNYRVVPAATFGEALEVRRLGQTSLVTDRICISLLGAEALHELVMCNMCKERVMDMFRTSGSVNASLHRPPGAA